MPRPIMGRSLYGMWGPVTDAGERVFVEMMKAAIPGIDMGESPYRDYEAPAIAEQFRNSAANAIRLLVGSSLGANNGPIVGIECRVRLDGMWGFQPSDYGARAKLGTTYEGITPNVLFAHCVVNPNVIMTGGLGAYRWVKAPGNGVTNLYVSERDDFHPGETHEMMQTFLAEQVRVVEAAQKVA